MNRLRLEGMAKRAALIAGGQTRMRPILMTALTAIFGTAALIFSQQIGSSMERGMAIVVGGGLLYATVMTLFIEPVIYDIFCRKPMRPVEFGGDIDDDANDAEVFIAQMGPDARETYDYESWWQRRKHKKKGASATDETADRTEPLPLIDPTEAD